MTSPKKKPKRLRSYIAGEKGRNRVRLYAHPRDGRLFLEYRDENGVRKRHSLRHDDFARGKEAADALAAEFQKVGKTQSQELILSALFTAYAKEVTPTKSASTRKHDERARSLFERCWGKEAKVENLDRRDWDRFIQQRRSGELRPPGDKRKCKGVRDRVIEYDLKFLLAVCNWAEVVRVNGSQLLKRNPFRGFPIPTETNPARPSTTEEEFSKLQIAAKSLGADVELFLLITHETGHRRTAVGRLRWSDIDFTDAMRATVRWRSEHDKIGLDHTVPLSTDATEALQAARRRSARIGDGWVFPSPTDPEKPIRADLLRDWWQKLERLAVLPRIQRRGWHSLRRKFATELKHDTPLADLCYLGGWKDPNTVLKCYMKPDERTMRSALSKRAERRVAGT
jgi:integrase